MVVYVHQEIIKLNTVDVQALPILQVVKAQILMQNLK